MSSTSASAPQAGAGAVTNPTADSAPPWSGPAVAAVDPDTKGLNPIATSGPPTAPPASIAAAPDFGFSGFTNPSAVSAAPDAPPASLSVPAGSMVGNDSGQSGPPDQAPVEGPDHEAEGLNPTATSEPPAEVDDDPEEVSKPRRSRPGRSRRSPRSRS